MVVIQALTVDIAMEEVATVVHTAVEAAGVVAAVVGAVLRSAAAVAMGMELTTDQLQQPTMVVQDMVPTVEGMVHMEVTLPMGQVLALLMVVLYMEARMVPMGHMGVPTEVAHTVHPAAMVQVQAAMVAMGELEVWVVVGARVVEALAGTTHTGNESTAGF